MKVLDLKNKYRKLISCFIEEYVSNGFKIAWNDKDLQYLQQIIQAILEVSDNDFLEIADKNELAGVVRNRLKNVSDEDVNEICFYLTYSSEEQ